MFPSGEQVIRYKYIHIWSSSDELRVKCTDSKTLESTIRAINKSKKKGHFEGVIFERNQDITGHFHVLSIKGMEEEKGYRRLAWWLFSSLCNVGWEPMETSERSYKMKFVESSSPNVI